MAKENNILELFEQELNLIQDERVKEFTKEMLLLAPDYFRVVPASSTGKYHPAYALGEGGLVRHTRAAVRIAHELLRVDAFKAFRSKESLIYSALILHDTIKHGLEGSPYTVVTHPILAADFIYEHAKDEDVELAERIGSLIESHMGQWNKDYKTKKEVLPKPHTKLETFIHLCDYLASRPCLTHDFDANLSS